MRGSVTRVVDNGKSGFILGEDGSEIYFDETSTDDLFLPVLSVGDWVEYETGYIEDRLRAVLIRPLRSRRFTSH